VVPKEFVPAVEKGLREAMLNGPLAGYPVVGLRARLVDGSYHEVDSDALSFEIAARMCFREAAQMADPVLLEPIMLVEVITPEEYMGDILGDLNARRGRIEGIQARPDAQVIRALVPLAEMFGYATQLRSLSQGRALYTMQFHHYQEVPKQIAEEIIAAYKGKTVNA
jgi:elongation factor G